MRLGGDFGVTWHIYNKYGYVRPPPSPPPRCGGGFLVFSPFYGGSQLEDLCTLSLFGFRARVTRTRGLFEQFELLLHEVQMVLCFCDCVFLTLEFCSESFQDTCDALSLHGTFL